MINLEHARDIGIDAAKKAGEILQARFRTELTINTKSSPRDLVTEVDAAAQEIIIATIQKEFPEHRFIAEEEGAENLGNKDCPYTWIIDPLDGTTNFIHGKKECGTLIALQHEQEFVVAVMYEPMIDRLYTAVQGGGAFCNGKSYTLRKTRNLNDALLCSNLRGRAVEDESGILKISLPNCGGLLNYGCALTEFGEIVRGYNDGLFFDGVGLWDIAAGCLMVQEAGGQYRYEFLEEKNPKGGVKCVASTPEIFEELSAFLF